MRGSIAAAAAAFFLLIVAIPAVAAPTQVSVRIEGKTETIFEGPVLAEPHRVRDVDDSQWRRCNGVTATSSLKVPSVVPTSASSDAMRIAGESFDARWFGQWEDYYVERWGPDLEDLLALEYWGVLVNNVYTSVGGCQYPLDGGDEVVWAYDAFHGRPRLLLYPVGYAGGAVQATATATLDQPFEVVVNSWLTYNEGSPPPAPTRSTTPYVGAEVAPVETGPKGFQRVDLASPKTVVTGADGKATIVFTEPGWHRIKATDTAADKETAIRSNRLDVCVPQPPATGCGALPADALARTPPAMIDGEAEVADGGDPGGAGNPGGGDPGSGGGLSGGSQSSGGGSQAASGGQAAARPGDSAQVRLRLLPLDRSRLDRGLVRASWRVLDPGAGIAGWTVASKAADRRGARWVQRARGRGETATTVRLPAGSTQLLRLTVTDARGESTGAALGRVVVPR